MIRCYNLFPSNFKNIDEMTEYLPKLKELGMNVVWLNPIQAASRNIKIEKSNLYTSVYTHFRASTYATFNHHEIDKRFSVVARNDNGDMLLESSQSDFLQSAGFNPKDIVNKIAQLRENIKKIEINLISKTRQKNKLIKKNKVASSESSEQFSLLNLQIAEVKAKVASLKEQYYSLILAQKQCIQLLDYEAIKRFTTTAKELGIKPIFDLVLNHVSIDSPLYQSHPEWFDVSDRTYPDAIAFIYSKLNRNIDISDEEREQISQISEQIIENVFNPFIETYVDELGFSGARIDCVRKVPSIVRAPVYQKIHALSQEEPVILEETLFSDLNHEQLTNMIGNVGATHATGSAYYHCREWHGGIDYPYNEEDHFKRAIVQEGVINFTGNHDHYTCAMTVCREIAFERLQANQSLYAVYQSELHKKNAKRKKPLDSSTLDIFKTRFIHFYVNQIIQELNDPDNHNDFINQFGKRYRDKLLTSMLIGSGGYYMLSGDEYATFYQESVFERANGKSFQNKAVLKVFLPTHPHHDLAMQALKSFAKNPFTRKKNKKVLYQTLSDNDKEILLSPLNEHLFSEINSLYPDKQKQFTQILIALFKKNKIEFNPECLELESISINYQNRWNAPESLSRFVLPEFFREINDIIQVLPKTSDGYWSELFKTVNEDILISVRSSNHSFDGQLDIIIINLNPDKEITVELNDIEKIAFWLQKRLFPRCTEDSNPEWSNPEFHKAYGAVMGSARFQQKPANLYFAGRINLNEDLSVPRVLLNNDFETFDIKVTPSSPRENPLLSTSEEHILPDTITYLLSTRTEQLPNLEKDKHVIKKDSPSTSKIIKF